MEQEQLRRHVWIILHEMMAHVSHQPSVQEGGAFQAFCFYAAEAFTRMGNGSLTPEVVENLNRQGAIIHQDDHD